MERDGQTPDTRFANVKFPRAPKVWGKSPCRVWLAKGEELFSESDVAEYFYKVVAGTVRTYKLLSDGRRHIDAFHLPGDIVGIEAGSEHRFSAEAVSGVTVSAWRRSRLEQLTQEHPTFAEQVMASIIGSPDRAHDHIDAGLARVA